MSRNRHSNGANDSQLARDRSERARIAALNRWGHADGSEGTAAARTQFLSRFEKDADPEGTLPEEERAIRAARLKSAYFRAMALRSAQVRRDRASSANVSKRAVGDSDQP